MERDDDAFTLADVDRMVPQARPSGAGDARTGVDVDRKVPSIRSVTHLSPMRPRKPVAPEIPVQPIRLEEGQLDVFPVLTRELPPEARLQPSEARLLELRRVAMASLKPKVKEAGSATAKGTTRTLKTLSQYGIAADRLKKRFCRETRTTPEAMSPVEFAAWFLSLRRNYKASSWRFNRQAAIFALESFVGEHEVNDAISMVENEARWDSQIDQPLNAPKIEPVRKTVTSANKKRYFGYEDFERIEAHLRVNRHSEKTGILIDWLRAGIFTGLRPEEWRATEVCSVPDPKSRNGRTIYLFVLNAKATNGRGNGVMRTLNISSFTDTTLASVEIMSRKGAEWALSNEYSKVQSQCAQHLYRTQERLFKRRASFYSLYSTRHQFVLNMRALMRTDEEISALLGHNVTATQSANYGQRSKGWSEDKILDKPTALVEEIATVRKTAAYGMERERLRRLAEGRTDLPTAEEFVDEGYDQTFGG